MSDFQSTLAISASGMAAQSDRLRFISENIANADTPGYHRKETVFEAELAGGRPTGRIHAAPPALDQSALSRIYNPGNPMADAAGYYDGSNVDMMVEVADARQAQRSYEANLKLFDQVRQMSQSLFELLRK